MVLQVLPRLFPTSDSSRQLDLGMAALLAPLIGAAAGALLAAAMGESRWRAGMLSGLASQAASVPGYLAAVSPLLSEGFLVDVAFYTALLYAHVTLSIVVGTAAAAWFGGRLAGIWRRPDPVTRLSGVAFAAGGVLLLAAALSVVGEAGAPWAYAVILSLAAAGHVGPVVGRRGWLGWTGAAVLFGALALAGFAGAAVTGRALSP